MIQSTVTKIKQLFTERKRAYCQSLDIESRHGRAVLEDLTKFCRANETTYANDPRMSAVLEGRREVWLRIQNYLNLSVDDLYDLHQIKVKGE